MACTSKIDTQHEDVQQLSASDLRRTGQQLNISTYFMSEYYNPLAQEASALGEIVIQEIDNLGKYQEIATEQRQATRFSISYDLPCHC